MLCWNSMSLPSCISQRAKARVSVTRQPGKCNIKIKLHSLFGSNATSFVSRMSTNLFVNPRRGLTKALNTRIFQHSVVLEIQVYWWDTTTHDNKKYKPLLDYIHS